MKDIMAGVDLHSNNLMLALVDRDGKRLFHKKLDCRLDRVQESLSPYRTRLDTIAVESTFNWYWLVDGLQDLGYHTVLANPAGIQQYAGIKHTDDKHDAFWLAEMLRLKILPTGYICERKLRPVRDLLRRRLSLVRKRTSLILSFQSLHVRMHGSSLKLAEIKRLDVEQAARLFASASDQLLAQENRRLIEELERSIQRLEKHVLERARNLPEYQRLLSIPGIGRILGMTIALETGPASRFPSAGDFASYCRTVRSLRTSNNKKKGENNTKCGNKYLAWAFVEAANLAQRFDPQARIFYERKKSRTNTMVATKALACKLAKAAWFVMRDNVDYDGQRVFGEEKQSRMQEKAAGARKVSLARGTEVEEGKKKGAGEKLTSPVETPQLSGQTALGLRSRRALSSAGRNQSKTAAEAEKTKLKQTKQTKQTMRT